MHGTVGSTTPTGSGNHKNARKLTKMDSLTQATLGAALGELVLGRRIGNKAALYGAVIATWPDLDVLIPMGGPVADFTYHRSWSHSVIMLTAVTPLIATVIYRWRKDPPELRMGWMTLVFLALVTHPLLDTFTVYGTQLLWPVSSYPFGLASIFIIDPLYSVPLVGGVLAALIMTRRTSRGRMANVCGLVVSSAYLGWTLIAQAHADRVARMTLKQQGVSLRQVLTIPAPFNTALWRTIAISFDGASYYVGYQSFLDGTARARFKRYPARQDLALRLDGHWPADRLRAFTKGYYSATFDGENLVISDLRMGVEGRYVFAFQVATRRGSTLNPTADRRVPPIRDLNGVGRLWARIWDDRVVLVPDAQAGE